MGNHSVLGDRVVRCKQRREKEYLTWDENANIGAVFLARLLGRPSNLAHETYGFSNSPTKSESPWGEREASGYFGRL